jgi:hypothetical protein
VTSFKVGVNTAGDRPNTWNFNGLRFATQEEAQAYGIDLMMRWTAVRDFQVFESDEEPNR